MVEGGLNRLSAVDSSPLGGGGNSPGDEWPGSLIAVRARKRAVRIGREGMSDFNEAVTFTGRPIRAIVVDDEPLNSRMLTRLLEKQPGFQVIGRHQDPTEALEQIRTADADALFLDIRMPRLGGFELLERIDSARRPLIVFVTAFDQFAVRAFEVAAVDYLMKPFDELRVAATVERLRARLPEKQRPSQELLEGVLDELRRHRARADSTSHHLAVWAPGDQRALLIPLEDVFRMTAMDKRIEVQTAAGRFELNGPLKEREALLDPQKFVRINRSTIVNVKQIKEIQRWFRGNYLVILKNGERVRSSHGTRSELESLLQLKK
jgi:two-component system LytT family response regulator